MLIIIHLTMFSLVYFNMVMYFIIKAAPVTISEFKGLMFLVHSPIFRTISGTSSLSNIFNTIPTKTIFQ